VPNCGLWWGSALAAGSGSLVQAVTAQQQATGRRLDIVHTYHRWYDQFPTASERRLSQDGHLLLINWEPTDRAGRAMSWQAIADGSHDAQIRALGTALATLGQPVLLSFSHEPELNYNAHGGSASAYVAAYRRVSALGVGPDGAGRSGLASALPGALPRRWLRRLDRLGSVQLGRLPAPWLAELQPGRDALLPMVASKWLRRQAIHAGRVRVGGAGRCARRQGRLVRRGAGRADQAGQPQGDRLLRPAAPPANCDWLVASSARSTAGFRALARSAAVRASTVLDPAGWVVGGYQADMEAGDSYSGILYEERMTRGIMAECGEDVGRRLENDLGYAGVLLEFSMFSNLRPEVGNCSGHHDHIGRRRKRLHGCLHLRRSLHLTQVGTRRNRQTDR